MQISEIMHAA